MHGKTTSIIHTNHWLFEDVPSPFSSDALPFTFIEIAGAYGAGMFGNLTFQVK